jgi:hypothetical protein
MQNRHIEKEGRRHNSTYKKLAVQWLNEALCFVLSLVLADSFRASKSPTSCSCKTSGCEITTPNTVLVQKKSRKIFLKTNNQFIAKVNFRRLFVDNKKRCV